MQPELAETVKGRGRHYRHPSTKQLHISVTNVLSVLNKPAIPRWAAKLVAEQAAAMKTSLPNLEDAEIVDMLKGAPWRTTTRAAGRGGDVHQFLQDFADGKEPPALVGAASEYQHGVDAFLNEHTIEALHTEVTVFSHHGYAGTADFLGTIDGVPTLMDYKSGKALYKEVALQTAALRHADEMWVCGELKPMPSTDVGLAVLFTTKGYKLREVKSDEETFATFVACVNAWKFVNEADVIASEPWHAATPDREGPEVAAAAALGREGPEHIS